MLIASSYLRYKCIPWTRWHIVFILTTYFTTLLWHLAIIIECIYVSGKGRWTWSSFSRNSTITRNDYTTPTILAYRNTVLCVSKTPGAGPAPPRQHLLLSRASVFGLFPWTINHLTELRTYFTDGAWNYAVLFQFASFGCPNFAILNFYLKLFFTSTQLQLDYLDVVSRTIFSVTIVKNSTLYQINEQVYNFTKKLVLKCTWISSHFYLRGSLAISFSNYYSCVEWS